MTAALWQRAATAAWRAGLLCTLWLAALPADAQLRVVSYNTAMGENPGVQTARPGLEVVLEAIGAEVRNGFARPIDVLLLQEQFSMEVSTQSIVNVLNSIYGPGVYARSTLNGQTSDSLGRGGRPGMVYNTQTVQLVSEMFFGDVGTSDGTGPTPAQQPRSTLRYELKPVGYDDSAVFYAYSAHWKADTGVGNNNRRLVEAQATRANADALGEGVHIIYAGDFNIQTSSGTAYQHMLSAGPGQAFDPLNRPGSWNNNTSFMDLHTQSPAATGNSQFPGQTLGGMDDRFDFQLVTGEMLDGMGLSMIPGSYRAFGNNGTHEFKGNITSGTGASPAVLTALMQASDHLPVVADYQLPARMGVDVAAIPPLVELGSLVTIGVTVTNTAPTALAIGADRLDYTLSVAGSLMGGAMATDFAGGGGNLHQITLDTSTVGLQTGMLNVVTTRQQAANPTYFLPIEFQVISAFLEADFNRDGVVDAADLAAWQGNFGLTGATRAQGDANLDGVVDGNDFVIWQRQLGMLPAGVTLAGAVPEPASGLAAFTALVAVLSLGRPRRRPRHAAAA